MMSKIARFIVIVVFIMAMPWLAYPAQAVVNTSILFVQTDPELNGVTRDVEKIMRAYFMDYSRMKVSITIKNVGPDFYNLFATKQERYIQTLFEQHACQYLLVMRKVDQNYYSFELWSESLLYYNLYMVHNETMKHLIPDIAANAYIGLLFQTNDLFRKSRLY